MKRPFFVTALGWSLIAVSVLTVAAMVLTRHDPAMQEFIRQMPVPVGVQHCTSYSGSVVNMVAGIAMLKAKNWGRWLYVVCGVGGIIFNLVVSPGKPMLLYGVVLFVLIVFFLFRSRTHCYFQTSGGVGNA